jgi:integrase
MSFRSKNIVRAKFPRVYEYEHPKTGRYFLVDARKLGKKERKTFQSKTLALKHAADVEEQFNKFGAQADVPKEKVVMADRFQGLTVQLAHFGKSPEDAVKHYVEHLGLEALRHVKPFIRDLVDQWEKYKKADQTVTKRYLNEVHSQCMFIKRTWGNLKPDDLKRNVIDLKLKGMKVKNNTRRKYRLFIGMFFKWVVDEGHLLKNPAEGIKFKSEKYQGQCYKLEQTKKLLRHVMETNRDLIGYFAVLTFAGLRPTEGQRVQWEDYNEKTHQLYVREGKTPPRFVDLEPVAVEWMKFHRENTPEGKPFVTLTNLENRMKVIRTAVFNGGWIQDGLRHGFGTHYKALTQSINKVADQMGNSVGIVLRHYARTITKGECDQFWGLTPTKVMADEPESNPTPTTAA